MPPDLFTRPAFSLTPESGRTEPRMWVRRLVIWREPATVIQDVSFKRGLNIIWSPDSTSPDDPIGHGGGKTTFCRLLRFCLGENSFAPDTLRHRISTVFPKGYVGAEIILNGELWMVLRGLGERQHDIVLKGRTLDDAFKDEQVATGIKPLSDAITEAIVGSAAALMPKKVGKDGAWKTLLAWLTRDQECRFGHLLDWRSVDSDSLSPVRNLSNTEKLFVVRALLGALSKEELSTQQREEEDKNSLAKHRSLISRLEWESGRVRSSIVNSLGDNPGLKPGVPMDIATFKSAASQAFARASNLPEGTFSTDVAEARKNRDSAKSILDQCDAELRQANTGITEKESALSLVRGELPDAYAKFASEKNPVCPVCKVLIDKALAEGCGISTETCDLHALQSEIAKKNAAIAKVDGEIRALRGELPGLRLSVATAKAEFELRSKELSLLEKSFDNQTASVSTAQSLVKDVERYETITTEHSNAILSEGEMERALETTRNSLSAYRAAASNVINRLSMWFDAILGELVPGDIRGEAILDGNGLTLRVELGGDRSTAAIDSLKVVAFDLAVLAMSVESRMFLPTFLVHDSPREADLSSSIYERFFTFAAKLEGYGPEPLFQYIMTTTSAPPDAFQDDQWVRLKVKGSPATERLLKVDL